MAIKKRICHEDRLMTYDQGQLEAYINSVVEDFDSSKSCTGLLTVGPSKVIGL